MEISAKGISTGRPLSNVGVVDKTIKIAISRSATESEIDEVVEEVLERFNVPDSAPVITQDDMVLICYKPICPFCDMDFGHYAYLLQHLDTSSERLSCMSS